MIIVKLINQRVVQVALTGSHSHEPLGQLLNFATKNNKQFTIATRTLVQTANNNQKVTNANNQQLVPIARNISFRQCRVADLKRTSRETSAKASYSISAPTSQFVTIDSPFHGEFESPNRESPIETLTKRAKEIREKKVNKYYGQSFDETVATNSQRRVVVLLSWLEAKEKHIEKYRQFYLDRGFDVLNVKTSPLDLLLPNVGARKISQDFVRFMIEKQYSDVVIHGFSVGGYMFGRLLLEIDKHNAETRDKLLSSIKGLVFDSLVPFEGTCVGVANSLTTNPIGAKILENLIRLYLYLGHNIATKHYIEVSEKVWGGPLSCPTLFLQSKDDKISDHKIVERLENIWKSLGIETHRLIVDSSPHVQIFSRHQQLYIARVENFLKNIKVFG